MTPENAIQISWQSYALSVFVCAGFLFLGGAILNTTLRRIADALEHRNMLRVAEWRSRELGESLALEDDDEEY